MKRSLMLCMCSNHCFLRFYSTSFMIYFVYIYRDNCVNEDFRAFLSLLNDGFVNVMINIYDGDRFSTDLLINAQTYCIRTRLEVMKFLLNSPDSSRKRYLNQENTQKNIFHHVLFICIPKGKNNFPILRVEPLQFIHFLFQKKTLQKWKQYAHQQSFITILFERVQFWWYRIVKINRWANHCRQFLWMPL